MQKLPNNSVMGIGIFKGRQILLDYLDNTLTIFNDANFVKDNFLEFDYDLEPDGLIFNVTESGNKYRLVLDTGATASFIFKERLKSHKGTSCLNVHPEMDNKGCKATVLTFKSKNNKEIQSAAIILDGNFKHMGDTDGLVGNNFLWGRKLLIDFQNHKIYVSFTQKNNNDRPMTVQNFPPSQ